MGRRTLLLGATVVVVAGCAAAPPSRVGRQWLQNLTGVVAQLRNDEQVGAATVAGLASARRALHDDSELYVLLVAYGDFGGCGRMLSTAGATGRAAAEVDGTLARACVRLERAASLFTQSAGDDDPRALVAAADEAQRAWPLLDRAALLLAALVDA